MKGNGCGLSTESQPESLRKEETKCRGGGREPSSGRLLGRGEGWLEGSHPPRDCVERFLTAFQGENLVVPYFGESFSLMVWSFGELVLVVHHWSITLIKKFWPVFQVWLKGCFLSEINIITIMQPFLRMLSWKVNSSKNSWSLKYSSLVKEILGWKDQNRQKSVLNLSWWIVWEWN